VWISEPLDSDLFRCQWHRADLALAPLPPSTSLRISTISADAIGPDAPTPLSPLWEVGLSVAGEMQPPPQAESLLPAPEPPPGDFLVQSYPGQYLWLKVEMQGDGFGSPALREMRVHFPRRSYLEYLPAVYSAEEESRWFLERFLSVFQTEWDDLEQRVDQLYGLFHPDSAPAEGGFLELLARWVALPLEKTWHAEQQRALLQAVSRFYPQRGTAAGVRAFLQAYLQNMTGLAPGEQHGFPYLLEGHRERRRLLLNQDSGPAPQFPRLWSGDEVGRLQVNVRGQLGRSRLISTGDPRYDLFGRFAHRFRVFLPAAWVSHADDERMLRRALEEEKPAHASYDLCLVEARFRVGIQSTLGIDTVVGGLPQTRLRCAADIEASAPSRPAAGRLGYDTVLAGVADDPRLPLPAVSILM
jgi:phage tail-like protein